MIVAILYFSHRGQGVAERLALSPEDRQVRVERGGLRAAVESWWTAADAIVFVSSLGIAVRAIAPYLSDKADDPAVIVVPEDASCVVPLTGAHLGGGRDLAEDLAARLGSRPLHTTASDRAGLTAPDLLAARRGWTLIGRENLPRINARLLDERCLRVWIGNGIRIAPLPPEYRPVASPGDSDVIVSPNRLPAPGDRVQLVPRCVVAGTGCRKGVAPDVFRTVFLKGLERYGILPEAVGEIRTIPEKTAEIAIVAVARELGVAVVPVARETILATGGDFSPSAAQRRLGLPGVAEPCAASAGTLLGPRLAENGVTVALSLSPAVPGRLTVLGTGPGDTGSVTLSGRGAIEEADAVVGYGLYVDLLPPSWIAGKIVERYSMGEEELRVERAIRLAGEGLDVVLLSGGDPVLFGLAALARSLAKDRVPVRVLPGITAAQAAGAILGAPYTNGLVLVSLSDYLQPWPAVRRALRGAAASGMTTALYNPVKRGLDDKLREVRNLFSENGYELACLVRNASRVDASVRTLPIGQLRADLLDMRTLVLLPGASVLREGDLFLDRRGYGSEPKSQDPKGGAGCPGDAVEGPSSLMICLHGAAKNILVAGGGPVALRKVRTLLASGAAVRVAAPELVPELAVMAAEGRLAWERRNVARDDFERHAFALIALPKEETGEALALADGTSCLLDCCSDVAACDWSLAAQFRSGAFTIGVSSGGISPSGSAALKKRLKGILGGTAPEECMGEMSS